MFVYQKQKEFLPYLPPAVLQQRVFKPEHVQVCRCIYYSAEDEPAGVEERLRLAKAGLEVVRVLAQDMFSLQHVGSNWEYLICLPAPVRPPSGPGRCYTC